MASSNELTPQQRLFVIEWLVDQNATQAAIRAGYAPRAASQQASRLLSFAKVKDAIDAALAARLERNEVTAERVRDELAKIAFSDIRKVVRWTPVVQTAQAQPTNYNGGTPNEYTGGVEMIPSAEIDNETAAAIAEVSQGPNGIRIKMYDKRAALVDMGRHLGMFTTKVKLSGNVASGPSAEDVEEMTDEELVAFIAGARGRAAPGA